MQISPNASYLIRPIAICRTVCRYYDKMIDRNKYITCISNDVINSGKHSVYITPVEHAILLGYLVYNHDTYLLTSNRCKI